jgi:hypothetical protein
VPEKKSRFVLLCQQILACGAVLAVAAPAAGVITLDIVAPAPPAVARRAAGHATGSLVASSPVKPTVTTVAVTGVDPRGVAALEEPAATSGAAPGLRLSAAETATEAADLVALTAPEPVRGLGTVGVTWKRGTHVGDRDISVSVRTRTDGVWSSWQTVPYHDDHGPDPDSEEGRDARPGTDPIYLGAVDDVQMKAVTDTGTVPAGMQLDVVDPGREDAPQVEQPAIDTAELGPAAAALTAADTADPTGATDPTGTTDPTGDATLTGTPADVTPKPQIFSRAQWGADEGMRNKSALHYSEVHAGFVHHTVNANGYTMAQVPSIIRGIYAYHTRSKGWSDIGYNFLVDRFGRIWEGRFGGVDRPVVGAHTLNYNDYAFAMSAIGNYDVYDGGRGIPSQTMLEAYGRLFAWKLSLHGVDASSLHQWVGRKYLPAINGHRDVGKTACPGRYLYAKVPTIRALAAADQRPFAARGRSVNLSGSRWPDLVVRDRTTKQAYVVQTEGQLGFAAPRVAASGWSGMDLVTSTLDLNGDGRPDLMARDGSTKVTGVYPGDGAGRFGAAITSTSRFADLDQMVGVGDFDGDGLNDLVGRDASTHALYLFPGKGDGQFRTARTLAADWSGYDLTAAAGDLTGDGHPDLVARSGSALSLFAGVGTGSLAPAVTVPGNWGGFDVVSGVGDVTNDGLSDLVSRSRKSGAGYVYPGNGSGGFSARYGAFSAFRGLAEVVSAGPVTGTGRSDLVGRNSQGQLLVFANNGGRNIGARIDTGRAFPSADLVLNVGDWNGDGFGDVMTRSARDGALYLYAGDGTGHFPRAFRAATGWSSVRLVTAVGDITGDGFPDLMGQPRGKAMRIYPSNGRTGFGPSYVAHSAISGSDQVGVGLWNTDGSPDTVVRRTDGTLAMFAGNGPGGLTDGVEVGSGAQVYDWMRGVGDADGDGRPDVIGRATKNGALWLLPGAASGGFAPRRFVAAGFGGYDLGG